MSLSLTKKTKYILLLVVSLFSFFQPVWAAGPPAPSLFSNPLALILIILMILLLLVIAILAGILVGAADVKLQKRKKERNAGIVPMLLLILLLSSSVISAQDAAPGTTTAAKMIGGMDASTFYLMATVLFLELGLIIVMLINIRLLIKKEKAEVVVEINKPRGKSIISRWWDKMNQLRPVSQEAELDLGHEYDGIRELNNKLPPWWLYGFYLTIIFAGIYLWRFHVSHTGPSSQQEYEMSVAKAEIKIQEYLKAKGDAVDENTVTFLTGADDLAAGKIIYIKSCASCHTETGAGNVGPNLTDNYWIHGHDAKSIFKIIRYGINAMPQWQNTYSNKQLAQVTSYVRSLKGSNPPNPKAAQGIEVKEEEASAKPVADTTSVKNPVKIINK